MKNSDVSLDGHAVNNKVIFMDCGIDKYNRSPKRNYQLKKLPIQVSIVNFIGESTISRNMSILLSIISFDVKLGS